MNGTILVVDDEEALRKALAFDFKRKGFDVLEAPNGKEAFEIVKSRSVDLVLSDINMAGGGGVELLENIRAHNPKSPIVIFITGLADITPEEAYHKGVNAIFSKPFDRKKLLAAIIELLGQNTKT